MSHTFVDQTWDAHLAMHLAENITTGDQPTESYRAFMAGRMVAKRALRERGVSEWFAVSAPDGSLAASMGVVLLRDVARFQSVLTAAGHRRQGLARHLLAQAADWAIVRGARRLVIVADDGSDAARLYRTAGFTPEARGYSWYNDVWPPTATPAACLNAEVGASVAVLVGGV